MVTVLLQNDHGDTVPDLATLEKWVNITITQSESIIAPAQQHIVIKIVTPEESATLNQNFRHKSGPTNILSFPDAAFGGLQPDTLGDLAICAKLVEQEAKEQHKTMQAHWAHLVIHGCLHLLGFDHIEATQAQVMESLEIAILKQLTIANPYE